MKEHESTIRNQEDEHGWVNPAISLALYIAGIGTAAFAIIMGYIFCTYG